jgi:NAD(P)-dependent dehydrogenase (short-subunit alcohol dehydrogenase family)
MFSLRNRTALVTGSARGIGRSIAEQLADWGANVVLNDLDAGPLAETSAAIAVEPSC